MSYIVCAIDEIGPVAEGLAGLVDPEPTHVILEEPLIARPLAQHRVVAFYDDADLANAHVRRLRQGLEV